MTSPDLREKVASLRLPKESASPAKSPLLGWLLASLGVLAVVGVSWWLWPRAVLVKTAVAVERVEGGRGTPVLQASGYVTARRQATVSSKVTGKVAEVMAEEGLRFERGQVLARLDGTQARLTLELARASRAAAEQAARETEAYLREAERRLTRWRSLASAGIASSAEGDALEAEVESLRARLDFQRERARVAERELALAEQGVEDTVIRAPFSGIVISKNAQPGEMISPMSAGGFTRTGIATLVDMDSLEIEVDVNEAYIQRVHPGQKVEARLDAYPDWAIPARVITTIPAANRQKATVTVRIGFEALDPRILPDMGVRVSFLSDGDPAASPQRRILVPRAALHGNSGSEVVWVVGPEGRLLRRAVRVAPGTAGELAEVLAGVAPGERVVLEGPSGLSEGVKVREP